MDNRHFEKAFHLLTVVNIIRAFLESIHGFAAETDKSTLFLHKGTTSSRMIALCNIEKPL